MDKKFSGIYKGRKVLITGHTGFKGSWLALWLKELGAEVTGYALLPHGDLNIYSACELDNKINSIIGDVSNLKELKLIMDKVKPEIVFHLAAQSLVRHSYAEPVLTYETNVMGTVNILESSRLCPSVKVVIIVTSDKCYDNKEWIWGYRENDPMGGYDPYSSSKGCAELVTAAYRCSYFNPADFKKHGISVSSVRAGNVIGGGDWAKDRLVPDCIKSLVNGESISIRNPDAIRPWQYVLESLRGYLTLAFMMFENGSHFSGAWNFGPSDDNMVSVRELTMKLVALWGNGRIDNISAGNIVPHEANFLKLNICKAQHMLNWKPVVNIDKALEMTVDWYKHYFKNSGVMLEFSRRQIKQYSEIAF